jgi:hypothetical protein
LGSISLELVAAYQETVLRAGREAQSALRGFSKSREQSAHLARAVEAAKAASQLGRQQYQTGTVPFNTVFNLETAQVQQQDQWAVALGNVALNLIEAYRALGGGWELRLRESEPAAEVPSTSLVPIPAQETEDTDLKPVEAIHTSQTAKTGLKDFVNRSMVSTITATNDEGSFSLSNF